VPTWARFFSRFPPITAEVDSGHQAIATLYWPGGKFTLV
jgi:hypothetical protein